MSEHQFFQASVSPEIVEKFFVNFAQNVERVPPQNMLNYDETNLSDYPGRKKVIMKKGKKYPKCIMSHSKPALSIMYASTANGNLLPSYMCYKSAHMYES